MILVPAHFLRVQQPYLDTDGGPALPGYRQTTPQKNLEVPTDSSGVATASADSLSDMNKGMQRSGRFVIKKKPAERTDGSEQVCNHLQVIYIRPFPPALAFLAFTN